MNLHIMTTKEIEADLNRDLELCATYESLYRVNTGEITEAILDGRLDIGESDICDWIFAMKRVQAYDERKHFLRRKIGFRNAAWW